MRILTSSILFVLLGATSARAQEPAPLIVENTVRSIHVSEDGILHLAKGRGWIRTRKIVSDFTLEAEFRLLEPDTDAGIGIRALSAPGDWPRRGYRVQLSPLVAPGVVALDSSVERVETTSAAPLSVGAWHHVSVSGRGSEIRVLVDGVAAGVYRIPPLTGTILFDARKGAVEIRALHLADLPSPETLDSDAYHENPRFVEPKLVKEVRPSYTKQALRSYVEGVIKMRVTVREDGAVGAIRLKSTLHPDLEQQGVLAVRAWKFTPATLDGRPVPVWVDVEFTFNVK